MANIVITDKCSHQSGSCFSDSKIKEYSCRNHSMNLEMFNTVIDSLVLNGETSVTIRGGEPTLHLQFCQLIESAVNRFNTITLFSNGDMPEPCRTFLASLPTNTFTIVLNLTNAQQLSSSVEKTLSILGNRCMPGVTIYHIDQELDFITDYILKYDLKRNIRVDLAHPSAHWTNPCIHPRHYTTIGNNIVRFARKIAEKKIKLSLGCGFVPCMFDNADISIFTPTDVPIGMRCSAKPDILYDGSIIHCFPCSSLTSVTFDRAYPLNRVRDTLTARLGGLGSIGIFKECKNCSYRANHLCTGGCKAVVWSRFHKPLLSIKIDQHCSQNKPVSPVRTKQPDNPPKHVKSWTIPYIDQPPFFWEELKKHFNNEIKEVYAPLPMNLFPTGRPQQPAIHLDTFYQSSIYPISLLLNPVILMQPLELVLSPVLRTIEGMINTGRIASVTITNAALGAEIKKRFPHIIITASTLMDISEPLQLEMLGDCFDAIVVSSRIVRDLERIRVLRKLWNRKLKMIVNEGCLPGCIYRTQHFFEMASGITYPESLCKQILAEKPGLRFTGSWVLPQFLHLYDDFIDEYKLDGRVTLQDPAKYRTTLNAYIRRYSLSPDQIGGGPASVLSPNGSGYFL